MPSVIYTGSPRYQGEVCLNYRSAHEQYRLTCECYLTSLVSGDKEIECMKILMPGVFWLVRGLSLQSWAPNLAMFLPQIQSYTDFRLLGISALCLFYCMHQFSCIPWHKCMHENKEKRLEEPQCAHLNQALQQLIPTDWSIHLSALCLGGMAEW